jgi:hypothetical protein
LSFFAEKEFSISSQWLQTFSLLLPIMEKELDAFSTHTYNCSWQKTEPWAGAGGGRSTETSGEGVGMGERDTD